MTVVFNLAVFPEEGDLTELPVGMQAKGAEVGFHDAGLMRVSRQRDLFEGWSGYKQFISHCK